MSNPHDRFVRVLWRDPERIEAELRAALPLELVEEVEFGGVSQEESTLDDVRLTSREGDVLVSAPLRGGSEVWVLLEHQSTEDPRMACRVVWYLARVLERWAAQHPTSSSVPMLVAVVLAHGAKPWRPARRLSALGGASSGAQAAWEPNGLDVGYGLDDLARSSLGELANRSGDALYRAGMVLLRGARGPAEAVFETLRGHPELLDGLREGEPEEFFRYMLEVFGVSPERVRDNLAPVWSAKSEEGLMTGADQLRAEGEARGEARGEVRLLMRQLRAKFPGEVSSSIERRVASGSAEQRARWGERVLTASRWEEVFEG